MNLTAILATLNATLHSILNPAHQPYEYDQNQAETLRVFTDGKSRYENGTRLGHADVLDAIQACGNNKIPECVPAVTLAWDKVCSNPYRKTGQETAQDHTLNLSEIKSLAKAIDDVGTGCMAYSPGFYPNPSREKQAESDINTISDAITGEVCLITRPIERQFRAVNLVQNISQYTNWIAERFLKNAPKNAQCFYTSVAQSTATQGATDILVREYSYVRGTPRPTCKA